MKKNKINLQKGFSLLEIIGATFIFTIGILSLFTVSNLGVGSLTEIKSKLIGSYLSQEGIEIVRGIRDSNWIEEVAWTDGLLDCSTGCQVQYDSESIVPYTDSFLKINDQGFYGYQANGGTETIFKRKITIKYLLDGRFVFSYPEEGEGDLEVQPPIYYLSVSSLVSWSIKGKEYNTEAVEYLYDWK